MKRDKFKCKLCGDKENTLNVHHISYEYGKKPWEYEMGNFKTLCKHCHLALELAISFDVDVSKTKTSYKIIDAIPFIFFRTDDSCFVVKIIYNSEACYVIDIDKEMYDAIGKVFKSI